MWWCVVSSNVYNFFPLDIIIHSFFFMCVYLKWIEKKNLRDCERPHAERGKNNLLWDHWQGNKKWIFIHITSHQNLMDERKKLCWFRSFMLGDICTNRHSFSSIFQCTCVQACVRVDLICWPICLSKYFHHFVHIFTNHDVYFSRSYIAKNNVQSQWCCCTFSIWKVSIRW